MNCPFKKPSQFLHFKVGALNSEHPIAPYHLRNEHSRRRKLLHTRAFRDILIFCRRFVHLNINTFKIAENPLNFRSHIAPIKSAVARAEWRQGDRTNLVFLNYTPQIFQAFDNPFELGGLPPMLFGWEIDDPVWAFEGAVFRHKHMPDFDVLALAGVVVSKEIGWECLFEHQGDALAHDADGIDGIHQRLDFGFEEVALNKAHD